jgi:hypothetical protein
MLDAEIPLAWIVSWSACTMALMAKRYVHFSLNDLRGAVESISQNGIEAGPPVNSPVSQNTSKPVRPK